MNENLKFFLLILVAVFLGTSLANWDMNPKYKVDFVSATSTEPFGDYLTRQGDDGWTLYGYRDYSEGRQYIFTK